MPSVHSLVSSLVISLSIRSCAIFTPNLTCWMVPVLFPSSSPLSHFVYGLVWISQLIHRFCITCSLRLIGTYHSPCVGSGIMVVLPSSRFSSHSLCWGFFWYFLSISLCSFWIISGHSPIVEEKNRHFNSLSILAFLSLSVPLSQSGTNPSTKKSFSLLRFFESCPIPHVYTSSVAIHPSSGSSYNACHFLAAQYPLSSAVA